MDKRTVSVKTGGKAVSQ